jgi:hypothetical protein
MRPAHHRSSRAGFLLLGLAALSLAACAQLPAPTNTATALAPAELEQIGRRIWKNECDGKVDGLTSWNAGENFASLGIGHFIWYPSGVNGPFEESFPKLVAWLQQGGVNLPPWLLSTARCPWPDKTSFEADHQGQRQRDLRELLSHTIQQQTLFIIHRLDEATPKYQQAAGGDAARVAANIAALKASAAGNFALIDYVNFKGEGLKPEERYNGQGWGLLQVLTAMRPGPGLSAPAAFAEAAKEVLAQRVRNSPPARGEQRWLPGWQSRCADYAR